VTPAAATGPAPAAPRRRRFRELPDWAGRATRLVHGGEHPDLNAGAIAPPLYQTSTFRYPAEFSEAAERGGVYIYSREGNPTVEGPAEVLRDLEGGQAAELFGSGMGAIASTLLSLLNAGDEVVAPESLYGGTLTLLRRLLPRFGVRVRLLDDASALQPEAAVGTGTRLALVETPSNPLLRVQDIRRWADAVHRVGGLLLVDGTFASPLNQQPLAHGADLVVHSGTKYLGGHSDLSAGVLVGSADLLARIDPRHALGSPLDPFAAFLLHRSLKTLELRVERQNRNATEVLASLEGNPSVARLHYPGRGGAEQEAVAARQMVGRGGMVSVSLRGGRAAVERFLSALRIVQVASSFGGVESLVSVPRDTSHRGLSEAELTARGIDDGLVRLSLGIEDGRDLVRDVGEAIAFAHGGSSPAL